MFAKWGQALAGHVAYGKKWLTLYIGTLRRSAGSAWDWHSRRKNHNKHAII